MVAVGDYVSPYENKPQQQPNKAVVWTDCVNKCHVKMQVVLENPNPQNKVWPDFIIVQ